MNLGAAFDSGLWPQAMVDRTKCNRNVGVQFVDSQEECQAIAEAAGDAFYSFRHNANNRGHKCFSSATCDTANGLLLGDRTNEWRVYTNHCPPRRGVEVLSNDHNHGTVGQYFNFDVASAGVSLGRDIVHNEQLWAWSERKGIWAQTIVWTSANGGSRGDGHGRKNPSSSPGDWEVGDRITFADPTKSFDFRCTAT